MTLLKVLRRGSVKIVIGFDQGDKIADDGAGGREASGAFAIEHLRSRMDRCNFEGIELVPSMSKKVRNGNPLRTDAGFDRSGLRMFRSAGDQFDRLSVLARKRDVLRRDALDAFGNNIHGWNMFAERVIREDRKFLRGIGTGDIERRVRFQESARAGFGTGRFIARAWFGHAREDKVRRTVDDPANGTNVIALPEFVQRGKDGNASADRSGVEKFHAVPFGDGRKARKFVREHELVRRDHVFAAFERAFDKRSGFVPAAHEFEDDVDGTIFQQLFGTVRKERGRSFGVPWFFEVADGDAGNFDFRRKLPAEFLPFCGEHLPDSGSHDAKTGEGDSKPPNVLLRSREKRVRSDFCRHAATASSEMLCSERIGWMRTGLDGVFVLDSKNGRRSVASAPVSTRNESWPWTASSVRYSALGTREATCSISCGGYNRSEEIPTKSARPCRLRAARSTLWPCARS